MDKFVVRNGIKVQNISEGNIDDRLLSVSDVGNVTYAETSLYGKPTLAIPDKDLLGLWRFDEYNNSDIYVTIDSSVHENHGRMESPIPYELAVSGMGVDLIGYDLIGLSYATGGTNISISVWRIGTPPTDPEGAVMAGNVDSQPLIYIKQNGDIQETLTSTTMGTFPFDGKFHHIVMTFSGTVVQLYIDGHLIDTKPQTILPSRTFINTIGNIVSPDKKPYPSGLIDEFRIYDRVITAPEVNWLFENPSGNNDSIPQADWESTDISSKDYIKNKPTSLPPSPHTHDAGDITTGTLNQERLPIYKTNIITSNLCYNSIINEERFIYRGSSVCIQVTSADNGKEIIITNDRGVVLPIIGSSTKFYDVYKGASPRPSMASFPISFSGRFRVMSSEFYRIL